MKKAHLVLVSALLIVLAIAPLAWANYIQVVTPTLMGQNTSEDYTFVRFDLSWEHSFRDDVNWDAAWVFVKYQETGSDEWNHAYLNTTAGNHTIPAGYTCSVGVTGSYGMGVFIYRSSSGSGNTSLSNVKLRWEYGDNGLSDDATVTVKVFASEMVYVPEGTLNLNATASENMESEFFDDPNHENTVTQITSESLLPEGAIRWKKDPFGGTGNDNGTSYGSDALGASYPKGYAAFYCMKYEISQGQYADFLNMLSSAQASNRYPNKDGDKRHTISESGGTYSADQPDRACNYLSWMDGCAYADWAGLRPMTELEFEKACRGDQSVVADEFAWGTTNITAATTISGTENGTETITNANANCCYGGNFFTGGDGGGGPLRCGIFAKSGTTREQAGASYYGIMELSGSLHERCVTVADESGGTTYAGLFDGSHGDGSLSTDGYATNATWPGESSGEVTGALGSGERGGWWSTTLLSRERVSNRSGAAYTKTVGDNASGFRCVRSATESFTPSGSPGGAQYHGGSYDGYTMQTSPPAISLPVTLSTFTAQAGDGKVALHWITESEVDNLGFYVYRALAEDGDYERLTAELIAGAGNTATEQTYHFTDIRLTNGATYWYKIEDVAFDGTRTMHGPIAVTPQAQAEIVVSLPEEYALSPCYPNPFNPSTTIRYELSEPGDVRLAIYDVLGQEVKALVSERQPAGWYRVSWDGRNGAGHRVSSGAYLYRFQVEDEFLDTRKMMLVR